MSIVRTPSMRLRRMACGLLALAVTGMAGAWPPVAHEANAGAVHAGQSVPVDRGTAGLAEVLKAAVAGGRVLDLKSGELAGRGSDAVLAVVDPAGPGHTRLGEGPGRVVLLLVRDPQGELHEAARNDRLVPCAACGGIAGDPYSYTTLGNGSFTIITEGGAREHWSNAYSFAWQPARRTWILQQVRRKITDRATGRQRTLVLTAADFGVLDFSDVDPAVLARVELP